MVNILVTGSDPRKPQRGWQGKCGALCGEQSGAGGAERSASGVGSTRIRRGSFLSPGFPASSRAASGTSFPSPTCLFLGTDCSGRSLQNKEGYTGVRYVQLRERHVAGVAAGGPVDVGPVQPAVVRDAEPLEKLAIQFRRLQSVVVQESEPAPAPAQVREVPVSFPKAPPEEVQALLALVLEEPLAIPQPPRVLAEALPFLPEVLPLSLARPIPQPVPLSGTVVFPKGLRRNAGPTLLRLWSHGVPGGAQEWAREIQDAVTEPNPISLK